MSASPLNFKITDVGLIKAANAAASGVKIKFLNFKIASGFGYTATGTETALQGFTLYEAPITKFTDWVDGSLRVTLTIDPQAGPFDFGEVGLYLEDGTLFALAVLPQLQTKYSSLNTSVNATFTFNCHLRLKQGTAVFEYPDFVNLDGSETKVTAGENAAVSGSGSSGNPYVVSVPLSAIKQKINLEPEAGFGLDNTVPVSSAYPNALNPDGPTHMYMVDKDGQQTIFFTSTSAFDTRRLARARIVDGNTIVEDRNYTLGGEDITYILNGSKMSACVQTLSNKILVLNTLSSSNPDEWVLVADVTTVHSQTPAGMTGSLVQSSFHYSPEFNKILRVAGSSTGEIALQVLSASGALQSQSLVFSLNSVIDYTGGPSTTSVDPFGYTIGLHFAYSYSKKELVFQTRSYSFFAGAMHYARFKFAFNVPDAVWYGNFSGVTSQYSTYKYYVAGGANNGVLEVNLPSGSTAAGFSFFYSWDPFSNSYIIGRIYYWPADLGDVDWSLSNHTDIETFTYVPLPDATYIGKRIEAYTLLLGSNFIHTYGLSQLHGVQTIDVPYSGTLLVEGNLSFNTKVANISPSAGGHIGFDATSGNRYSCDGLNQQLYSWTETSTGWTKTAVSGKFSPPLAPAGYTICGNNLLYVSQLNKFVGLFYKNSDTRKYAYLIAFDAFSFTVLSTSINTNEVDSYFAITNGGLNYVYNFVLALIDNHLFCAFTCHWPGGLTGLRVSAFSKANLLSLNPNVSPILSSKTYYPYYASFAIGKDASGNLYTAENVKWPNTRVLVTKYSSSDAYLASDIFVSGGPASTNKTWLSVYTTSGLALYISAYPMFLGGYQCTIPQQSVILKPNSVSYLIATKTSDDKFTIQLSVVDYLAAGNSSIFNSFSQVCLVEVTTDSEKVTSKIDYTIRRDAQKLSKAGNILSISRGNSITL